MSQAISLQDIANLKDTSSYYLSDQGEVKEQGLWTKFKCYFNLGHSRQRVQNLNTEIQRTLSNASGFGDKQVANALDALGQEKGPTGAQIKEIFRNYKNENIDGFVKREAKGLAETVINKELNELLNFEDADLFFPAKDDLASLMRYALKPLMDNLPTKIEGGEKVLDKEALQTSMQNVLSDLSSILSAVINSQDLGMPVINSAYIAYL